MLTQKRAHLTSESMVDSPNSFVVWIVKIPVWLMQPLMPSIPGSTSRGMDSPVKNFSSGMRARLGFSIATIVRPDILIVDEILAVGDYSFQQKCLKRMDEMMGGGTTLLFVSHSIDQVRKLCDHAVWINKGQIMQVGEVNEVCDAYMATQKK